MSDDTDPKYLLGETQREVERLQKQHRWIQTCLKDKIVFAPVNLQDSSLRVLDVGCADGTLLRALQTHVSEKATLVGADIMKGFLPEAPQGNISYVVWDANEEPAADLRAAFDLTHVRYLIAGLGKLGVDKAVENLASTVAPGGWLQLQEMDVIAPRGQCSSIDDLHTLLAAIFDFTGLGSESPNKLDKSFKLAGLENITAEKIALPLGMKLETEQAARDSLIPFKITIPTLRAAIQGLGLDIAPSVFDRLEERFEEEMLTSGATLTTNIVWGQKPS